MVHFCEKNEVKINLHKRLHSQTKLQNSMPKKEDIIGLSSKCLFGDFSVCVSVLQCNAVSVLIQILFQYAFDDK